MPLDLTTGEINANYVLSEGPVAVLDYTLVSIVMVDDYPLVVTARRQLQDASDNSIWWFRVTSAGYSGVEGPLPTSVKAARLKKLSGGSGGMVLQLTTMKVHDKQMMIIWAVADAKGSQPTLAQSNDLSQRIHTISIYEINTKLQGGQLKVGLQLAELLLMLPQGMENTSDSWMLDLPLVGNVQATAEDVTFLPCWRSISGGGIGRYQCVHHAMARHERQQRICCQGHGNSQLQLPTWCYLAALCADSGAPPGIKSSSASCLQLYVVQGEDCAHGSDKNCD